MFLTRDQARKLLVEKYPKTPSNELESFLSAAYKQSNEADMGDILISFFNFWTFVSRSL